jgi:phenylpropionate dioxygenase-like ring-hydroxylating dioxygenase large terminal subunit/ferredoxin-NADP reductase
MTHMDTVSPSAVDPIADSMRAGWQLPARLYSDPAAFEVERKAVFSHAWQYIGRESDVSAAGAYLTAQVGDVPVVVVRDNDGSLHGHVNVCRHRLHPVAEGAGCRQLFQCRYHGWTYRHDGSLRSAPGLQNEDAFDRQTLGLRPILVDTFHGFVFANLDVEAAPLRDYLGAAADAADQLDLEFAEWEHAGTYTYEIPANWKLFTENALECYHCPLVHETTYATAFDTTTRNYICTEFENAAIQVAPVTELTEKLAARTGLDGFRLLYLWPVTFLSVDDFVGIVARTVPIDAKNSKFVVDTFVKPGTDPDVLAQWLEIYDRTFAEDKTVVAAQQAGYDSGTVPQGRLMTACESTIAMFQQRTWKALNHRGDGPSATAAFSTAVSPVDLPESSTDGSDRGQPWEAMLHVGAVTVEADGVVSISLSSANGQALPLWAPGAHIDLCMTEDLIRQYSLCGDPRDADRWKIAVLKAADSRGGSDYVHRRIKTGQGVRVRGPRNNFALPEAPAYGFVAGGIGITPILPMVEDAQARGIPWRLLYGGRTLSSMAFTDVLARYPEKVELVPQDTHGLPDLTGFVADAPPGAAVMACGPTGLLEALETVCGQVDHVSLHIERFVPSTKTALPNTEFDVTLARSGQTVRVGKDESVLDAVRRHGAAVLSSCREGTCGTCETAVLDGIPDHRDDVLTPEERERGDAMMLCVSRSATDHLVLDL